MGQIIRYRWLYIIMLTSVISTQLYSSSASAKDWRFVGTFDGVKVSKKVVKGSPLFAFKGITEAELPLDQIIATFSDPNQRKYWVDRYADHTTIKKTPLSETYWIHFSLPPLVSDRDYVLKSDASVNQDKGVIEVKIKSIEHPDYPVKCCVRAQVKETYYKFTALSAKRTRLEVEVHTDPKGMLPNWLVNLIQEKWPSKTLSGLIRRARKVGGSHSKTREWMKQRFK